MRSRVRLWTQTQKEDVNASERFKLLNVARQLLFKIVRIRPHRSEAFNFSEEVIAQKPLEIAHEAQAIIHSHWRERVLCENMKTRKQVVCLISSGKFA